MSTIKVDTLQTRAGSTAAVTGAGFVATDQIRGNTSAGSTTVVGEGGSTTTNLQQGLIKTWINFNGRDTIATRDTFNITSITDNAQGDYTVTIANDMGNANYCATMGNTGYDGGQDTRFTTTFKAAGSNDWSTYVAGSFRLQTKENANNTTTEDASLITVSVSGDLA